MDVLHDAALDLRETLSLRKTLIRWIGPRVKRDTARRLRRLVPYDFTIDQVYMRSTTTKEYLQHIISLAVMRRSFFKADSALHHAMDVIYEWSMSHLSYVTGTEHRCIYRKNSYAQDAIDARQRAMQKESARTARKRKRDTIMVIRAEIKEKRRKIREIDRHYKEEERIRVRAEKYEDSVKIWSYSDKVALVNRIQIAPAKNIMKMLRIVDWYIPGTFESGEIEPTKWTDTIVQTRIQHDMEVIPVLIVDVLCFLVLKNPNTSYLPLVLLTLHCVAPRWLSYVMILARIATYIYASRSVPRNIHLP